MVNEAFLRQKIYEAFAYSPTQGQQTAVRMLSQFIASPPGRHPLFLLNGFAGTGKTTLVSAVVSALRLIDIPCILLAPTGRAAKVLANYSQHQATTIHKAIYYLSADADGRARFMPSRNRLRNAVFIVDEVSMLPGRQANNPADLGNLDLLSDLVNYVFTGENCCLIFLGDSCQLPPVGSNYSPALDVEYLRSSYHLDLVHFRLDQVVRQALHSDILQIATRLREKIERDDASLPFFAMQLHSPDVVNIAGNELPDILQEMYSTFGREDTVFITRSNKSANLYNQAIRQRILFYENEIAAGDLMMVVRNNTFWVPEDSGLGFIANGDTIEIMSVRGHHELYGFHFADATIRMADYPNLDTFDVKLLLDTLSSESPSLPQNEYRRLFEEVMADYEELPTKKKKLESVRANPNFNALQIKYANALTCHKTQGGQWKAVFIDKGFLKPEMLDTEYLRWLYTAVTRTQKRLFLVNFDDPYFEINPT